MSRLGQPRPASAPVARPPYRAAAVAGACTTEDNYHRTADALEARRQCSTVAEQHHSSIVQMIRDRKREHVGVSLWAHSDPNSSSAIVQASSSTSTTAHYASVPVHHHNLRSNWMPSSDTSTSSTAQLSAPSITGLMNECRRRKLGRFKADSTRLTEVQYRERLQRSWLQGWWFLWQRCIAQLHDAGIRYAQVSHELVGPQRRHIHRRMTLRRDLSKSLESLNHIAHMAERYTAWIGFHLRYSQKQRITEQQHQLHAIEIIDGGCSGEPDVSHIRRGQSSPCEQHLVKTNGDDARQVERRAPSPSTDLLGCNDLNQSSSPSRYRGYVVEDPWSPSQHPARTCLTSSNPSDRSRSGLLSHLSDNEVHLDHTSNEAFAILALESHANELLARHVRKLCKIVAQEEAVTRLHAQRQTFEFILSRNIEMAWILSADRVKDALRQHAVAAYVLMEDISRRTLESLENSVLIDKIVEWKIERRVQFDRQPSMPSRKPAPAGLVHGVETTCEVEIPQSISPAVLMMGGAGLVRWAAQRVQMLQRTCRGYSCRRALLVQPPLNGSNRAFHQSIEHTVAALQAVGRGYVTRNHARMQFLFWQVDRRIRKETWDGFCHVLVRLAGRLASLLEQDELAQKHCRAVRVVQSVGRAYLTRTMSCQLSLLFSLERIVRNSLAQVLSKEHLAVLRCEPVQRLVALQSAAYATICEQQDSEARAIYVSSTISACNVSSHEDACTVLQRIGRATFVRKSLFRLSTFWQVDCSIRKETFSAWLSKAVMMARANSRMVIRISEREQRLSIETLMDASYCNLSQEYQSGSQVAPVLAIQRIGRAHTQRRALRRNVFFWRVDQSVRSDAMAAWLRVTSTLSALCRFLAPIVQHEAQSRATLEERALTGLSELLAEGRSGKVSSALLLQRVARGHHVRCAAKRLATFWNVDTSIRGEAFDAWLRNAVRMQRAACRDRFRVEETLQRRRIVEIEQAARSKLLEVAKYTCSSALLQRVGRGHLIRVGLERLFVFWGVDASIRRDTFDAWVNATARVERAANRDRLRIEEKAERIQISENEACERRGQFINRVVEPVATPLVDANRSNQSSNASVSSDDDNQTMRIVERDRCDSEDEIDVSSEENDTVPAGRKALKPANSNSDVDVSSDEDDKGPTCETPASGRDQPLAPMDDGQGQHHPANPQEYLRTADSDVDVSSDDDAEEKRPPHRAPPVNEGNESDTDLSSDATQRPSQIPMSMKPPLEESSDEDVDISSDDEDEAALEILQRLQQLVLTHQNDAREKIMQEEVRRRSTVRRYHLAEMEAIFVDGSDAAGEDDGSDEDVSDGDRSLHFTPEVNVALLNTPAKSDTTHPPHSVRKQTSSRFSHQHQHGSSSVLGRAMSTSSSVTLMKSTSGGNRDDSVEIISVASSSVDDGDDDSSIDISSSEDDGTYQQSRMVGPSNSSVRNIYMRVFADQRAKLEASETLARRNIETDLCKLQLSLLSAQEYLVRHSTLVHSRNRFARTMLETKQRLSDMARIQLHRTLSSNTKANLSSQPLPRGAFPPRSRRTLSSDSVSTGGASTTGGGSPADTPIGMSPMMIRTGSSASMVFRQVAAALESESRVANNGPNHSAQQRVVSDEP